MTDAPRTAEELRQEKQRRDSLKHMLVYDEREKIYKPVPIPQYERGDI